MPSCVCPSCGAGVRLDAARRFVRCGCGATFAGLAAPADDQAARIGQEIEAIVARLKRMEAQLVIDVDRGHACCAHLDELARRYSPAG